MRKDVNDFVSMKILAMARVLINITATMKVLPHIEAKLQSLVLLIKCGKRVTQEKMKHKLLAILGVAQLQVLLSNQRLAELIILQAHRENHDCPKTTLARSRSQAWIH